MQNITGLSTVLKLRKFNSVSSHYLFFPKYKAEQHPTETDITTDAVPYEELWWLKLLLPQSERS